VLTVALSVLAALSAAITIYAKYRPSPRLEHIFKPLTMGWIILIALTGGASVSTRYQMLIVLGLASSLAGDVLLMLPGRFLYGLVAFLIAHLLYIAAFTTEAGGAPLWTLVPFLAFGGIMLRWLWPGLGRMRLPALIYVAVILIMAWQAANRWVTTDQDGALLAFVGAYLFVTSDGLLAVERFRGAWRSAPFWVLSTYFAAQWLIALSV